MERAAPVSRRKILIGLAGAALAAVVASPMLQPLVGRRTRRLLASNAFTRRFLSLAHAGQAEWMAQVGSTFTAAGGYHLRLEGVTPFASSGIRPPDVTRDRAFGAVFEIGGGMTMAGDLIYTLSHPQYGELPVFLSATGNPARMLAVFN